MPSAILYFRQDTHIVNGQSVYKLDTPNTSVLDGFSVASSGAASFNVDVYIRHADGSDTLLGSGVANVDGEDYFSSEIDATWTLNQSQSLVSTDRLKVVLRINGDTSATRTFITPELGWTSLNPSTWHFYRGAGCDAYEELIAWIDHGANNNSYGETRIAGIDYTAGAPPSQGISPTGVDSTSTVGDPSVAPGPVG